MEFIFVAEPDPQPLRSIDQPPSTPKSPLPKSPTTAEGKSAGGKGKKDKVVATAPASERGPSARERLESQNLLPMWAGAGAILAVVISGWWFFLPLTYGKPGLDVAQVNARKWLGYDLHFAK